MEIVNDLRCSDTHLEIGYKLNKLIEKCKTLEQLHKLLRKVGIACEYYKTYDADTIMVFTGSSGYDIVGYSVTENADGLFLNEMYN